MKCPYCGNIVIYLIPLYICATCKYAKTDLEMAIALDAKAKKGI